MTLVGKVCEGDVDDVGVIDDADDDDDGGGGGGGDGDGDDDDDGDDHDHDHRHRHRHRHHHRHRHRHHHHFLGGLICLPLIPVWEHVEIKLNLPMVKVQACVCTTAGKMMRARK